MSKLWTDEIINVMFGLYDDHTFEEIAKIINKKFKRKFSPNAIRKSAERHKYPVDDFSVPEMPKILALDIETKPLTAYVWGLWNNDVGLSMLNADWCILSWAAKWLHKDKIYYEDQRDAKDIHNDKKILKKIWKLLDEADIVLTQNGIRFDIPKLNARFVMNGMEPPSSFRHIDTLRIAKRNFKFTSNKLEFMTDKLCKTKKLKHAKFPGFKLWDECMKGNKEAWDEMKLYNVADIESLIELYHVLAPWDSSLNFSVYNESDKPTCSCGSQEFKKSGFYYTNASKFQKYRCKSCGREIRDKQNILTKKKKKGMTVGTIR